MHYSYYINTCKCLTIYFIQCWYIKNDHYNQVTPISLDDCLVSRERQSQPDTVWKSIRSGQRSIVRSNVGTGPGASP